MTSKETAHANIKDPEKPSLAASVPPEDRRIAIYCRFEESFLA
jgi:hypothetical protein